MALYRSSPNSYPLRESPDLLPEQRIHLLINRSIPTMIPAL